MLRPTEEELATARELGIDPTGLNGPQLRDEIQKARRSGRRLSVRNLSFYSELVAAADLLDVPIREADSVRTVRANIEARIEELFTEKGIVSGVDVTFTDAYPSLANQRVTIRSTKIRWYLNLMPQVMVTVHGQPGRKERPMGAGFVALYAYLL